MTMSSTQGAGQAATIFEEVRTKFLNQLPPSLRHRVILCSSPATLIDNVQQLHVISKHRQRGGRFMLGLKKLIDNLTPFFRVIDLVVSSHPEYAGIVWGALNLVMQLASNFTAFFEKLTKTLDRITKAFPAYSEVERIVKVNRVVLSGQVKLTLGRVYEDLFSFLNDVIHVFAKPDGCHRWTAAVVTSLAFKSFDLRFGDILSNLRDDQKLLELEIDILNLSLTEDQNVQTREDLKNVQSVADAHAKVIEDKINMNMSLTLEAKTNIESACQAMTLQNIRLWITVPNFATDLEECVRHREADTCNWIFDDVLYQKWCKERPKPSHVGTGNKMLGPSALWLHGSPGTGKSVLSATVIEDLQDQWNDDDERTLVLYYFFKAASGWVDPTAAYRAMLAQILHRYQHDSNLVNKFSFAMLEVSKGQSAATQNELLDLLRLCFDYFDDVFIVLDGIDECQDSERLLSDLESLGCGQLYRILLSSRINDAALLLRIPESQRISTSNGGVINDIHLYAERQLDAMVNQNKFPAQTSLNFVIAQTVKGAGHMFLWARLMILYLKSPALTQKQRLSRLGTIDHPEGLDKMYMRILELIAQSPEPETKLAMAILNWLAGAKRDLTDLELKEAMRIEIGCDEDDDFEDFRHSAVIVCNGLIEQSQVSQNAVGHSHHIQYIHLSAREFIRRLDCDGDDVPKKLRPYLRTESESNLRMAEICLTYIKNNMTGPLSGDIRVQLDEPILNTKFAFAVYSSSHWIEHLHAAEGMFSRYVNTASGLLDRCRGTFEALHSLLSQPFVVMAWVEASYACNQRPKEGAICSHEERITQLAAWCERHGLETSSASNSGGFAVEVASKCSDFCQDLSMLHQMLGNALLKSPRLIWDEAPAFAPSQFWSASPSTLVTMLRPDEVGSSAHDLSGQPLLTISESLLAQCLVGVLSIWPSRTFEEYWASVKDVINLHELYEQCHGWTGRYQIWSLNPPQDSDSDAPTKSMLDSSVILSQVAVWTAIHQSLRKESSGNWRFNFPVTIRQDLQAFTILQTVFQASNPNNDGNAIDITLEHLALEDLLDLKPSWWDLKKRPPTLDENIMFGGPHDMGTYYDYRLTFNPNGHMLYFRDFHQLQDSTLAVIALDTVGKPSVLQKYCTSPEWDEDIVAFHPWAPLLFIFRNRVVKVWKTSEGSSTEPELFYDPNCGYQDGLKEMQISDCGRFIIMTFPRRKPVIQSIEHLIDFRNDKTRLSAIVPQRKREMNPGALFQPGQVMRGIDLNIAKGGTYRSLYIHQHLTGVDVNEWSGGYRIGTKLARNNEQVNADNHVQQRLTVLPEWISLHRSQVSVRWPSELEQAVKIVIDQTAPKYHSHANRGTTNVGPIMIQRDIRALQDPVTMSNSDFGSILPPRDTRDKTQRKRLAPAPFDLSELNNKRARTPDEVTDI